MREQVYEYEPFGGAHELFHCRDDDILFEGPAGTGKSRASLEKVYAAASKYAGARVLICRKSRSSMTESTLVTWETKVCPPGDPVLRGPGRANRKKYTMPNGSEIVIGGLDNTDRIMSTEYDLILIPEGTEITEKDREDLSSRLRNGVMPYQQMIVEVNPARPTHHLNRDAHAGLLTRIYSRHADNPTLWDRKCKKWTVAGERYMARLGKLRGARRQRLLEGKWAAEEGMVYEEWNAERHILMAMPSCQRFIGSIDFGYTNPASLGIYGVTGDGIMVKVEEHVMRGVDIEEIGDLLIGLKRHYRWEVLVADHDAADRALLKKRGIGSIAAYKPIEQGLRNLKKRIGHDQFFVLHDALSFHRSHAEMREARTPIGFADEVEHYVWSQRPDERHPERGVPVMVDDHSLDEARYAAAYVDRLSGKRAGVLF